MGTIPLPLLVNTGTSTNPDSTAVHAHRMTTVRRWPWPMSIRRWCRCSLSAVATPLRRRARRMTANTVSISGTPRMNSGITSGAKKNHDWPENGSSD